jgi:hypothetical protein
MFDVLLSGQGIALTTQNNGIGGATYVLALLTPSGNFTIQSSTQTQNIFCYDFQGTDGNKYLAVLTRTYLGGIYVCALNVYRTQTNSSPILVVSTTVSDVVFAGYKMRRVVQSGNNFYLSDLPSGAASRNALLITQSGQSFAYAGQAYCNLPSDNAQSGTPGVTGSLNSLTVADASLTAAVYLPPGGAGTYIKVR